MAGHAMQQSSEIANKALNLDHPEDKHGATAVDHVGGGYSPKHDASDQETSTSEGYSSHEKALESLKLSSGNGLLRTTSGVDVEQAERDFADLSKQFSRENRRTMSRVASRASNAKGANDIEKAISSTSGEEWSLENVLRGNREAELEAGIKSKHIGVIWEGLTVRGLGGVKIFVKVFPEAFVDFFNIYGKVKDILGLGKKGREFNILEGFRGVAKPGEMVLVLGRPGSGCTTFLRTITNQRIGYTGIEGDVTYGPFDAKTFEKYYRGEAVYNQEDDLHQPTLTVGQTLGFALDVKTPGKRPAGMGKKDFKEKVIALLLKMFNIEHTKNTVVGNAFVRGISGGERKRVSIAEMMVTGATVCAWDNSTRGLDASTASDYAKSLRIMTNIYKTTTFVSLYQASETIYRQFDKVMVIDSGRQVFFGPAQQARAYFEGIGFAPKPRQTTPDYLTGCTDEFEREYATGRSPENAPSTPGGLVEAFNASKYASSLENEMNDYRNEVEKQKHIHEDFQLAHKEAKRKHTSSKSVYSVPYYLQIWALMKRQFILKWQDRFTLTTSWATSIIIAIVIGTVWLKQPETSAGAFTRGGALFIAFLFNAFNAFSELAACFLGRGIVNKHRAYTFHRPSALWIGQLGVDVAFASVQIFIFSVIVYFMVGLVLDAGAFFTFYFIIVLGYLCMTLFFRTLGVLSADFDVAIKFAALIITFFVVTSGYLIQWESQQVWLRWIYYINVMGLGFAALMANEFKSLVMRCTSESLIPSGPSYTNLENQVCTLAGSTAGSDIVVGTSYIENGFSYSPEDLWRNVGIIIALILFFLFINATVGELLRFGAGGKMATVFAREDSATKELNRKLRERKQGRQAKTDKNDTADLNITSKSILTWEGLNYDVPVPGGTRRLLSDVFGYVRPGELTALMGASGAGKTTLLDVLASRKNLGVISGDMLIDGQKPGIAFQRGTSYAEQLDVHEAAATVREALRFSADLRQPYEVSRDEKYAYVEEILSLLEMETLADAIIGDPESGLSVEERKRVTIGVELAAKPELLLFLDEPTSGLDSQSAFNIVRFLRKLAAAGQAILCTIHQPNSALFENFDRLLLLQKGGECVYFGDVGEGASILLDYFARHGAYCPDDVNPAEFFLDAIGAGLAPRIGDRDWGELWRESDELATIKQDIVAMKDRRQREVAAEPKLPEKEYASPLWHQMKVVSWRMHLSFWRSPQYGFTRWFNQIIIALVTGLAFLQLNDSRSSLQYRVFVIFQATVVPALILAQCEIKYDLQRLIYYREAAAKAYKQFPFVFAMVCAEMPYTLICTISFFLPLYYIPGFQGASSRAGYQFFMILILEIFSTTLGQTIAALTPSSFISSLVNPFVIVIFALFCGVTIPKPQIPGFWRAWLYELNPITRLVSGMVTTELQGRTVVCTQSEFNSFPAPSGTTCGDYMANFFAAGGAGYIQDPNATGNCNYCAYADGEQFYRPFQLSFDDRWRDLGILAAFIGSNLILLFLGSRYLNFNRR
ncbi:ATP-binding cassette transporter snq2 [Knufia obscura]|uniref:ATP-binding cassette transporter snq2 n=2 Tax=Knufia TaxID=430999 RepID=A0AAN8EJQ7_9EURO|nr:ATP-binding cassette transporter snq2 [Knufia obscura]KAK5951075.1 ATP-binding cassette transporter snq2 [Knufia fluminis]